MTLTFTAKKMNLSETFKEQAAKKLEKIQRMIGDSEATVKVTPIKDGITVEVTVRKDSLIIRAEETGTEKLDLIDDCVDTIARKIRKNKTKLEKRLHSEIPETDALAEPEIESEHIIAKRKTFPVKPMGVEEAILQMEMLGHSFFVYRDADTNDVNVVYRRSDGKYAVIESE